MAKYRELDSEYDVLPTALAEKLMTTKRDVHWDIDDRMSYICDIADTDFWHSAKYYSLLKEMIKGFKTKLEMTVLPKQLEDWWRYCYEISHKGIKLYLEHIHSVWLNEDTGELDELTVDQVFPLISYEAKMLTVDEYANLYGVEQVTVRQWIRRFKIREAEKIGKEWRISELTDVIRKNNFEAAKYRWIVSLKDLPQEFAKLNDFSEVQIVRRELNKNEKLEGIDCYALLSSRANRSEYRLALPLTSEQRDRLESYLISNPDVLFTGNTKTFEYKYEKEKEEYEEETE